MPLPLSAIQHTLANEQIDGWLLYDFHGSNPMAVALAGLAGGNIRPAAGTTSSPRRGRRRKLVHAIEPFVLDALPGDKRIYAGRLAARRRRRRLARAAKTVAMEYSPECAIPYSVARRCRHGGISSGARACASISSGDLVRRFEAAWDAAADRDAPSGLREALSRSRIARSSTSARSSRPAIRLTNTKCSSRWCSGSKTRA